jgi:hypothetical protein
LSESVSGAVERHVATALVAAAVLVTVAVSPLGDGVRTVALIGALGAWLVSRHRPSMTGVRACALAATSVAAGRALSAWIP